MTPVTCPKSSYWLEMKDAAGMRTAQHPRAHQIARGSRTWGKTMTKKDGSWGSILLLLSSPRATFTHNLLPTLSWKPGPLGETIRSTVYEAGASLANTFLPPISPGSHSLVKSACWDITVVSPPKVFTGGPVTHSLVSCLLWRICHPR